MWLFKITYNHIASGLSYYRHHIVSDDGEIDDAWDAVMVEARHHCEAHGQSLKSVEFVGSAMELPEEVRDG